MIVNIVMPVSRKDYLKQIFDRLELLRCDKENTNILTYVDGDLGLFQKARNLTVASKFNSRLSLFRNKGIPNVGSVKRRRQRIADIHNEIKGLIKDCDLILFLEDDTQPPVSGFEKLLDSMISHPHAGIVSGVEIGRWGFNHVGAWDCDDVYQPKVITSPVMGEGLVKVDATGLYFGLIRKDIYLTHEFKPFDTILGPDADLGFSLRRKGYLNYINFDVKCRHLTKRGAILATMHEIDQVKFEKSESAKYGWTQRKV